MVKIFGSATLKIMEAREIFDPEMAALAEYYERKARIESFDKLVDLALDGIISMEDAKDAWEHEQIMWTPKKKRKKT